MGEVGGGDCRGGMKIWLGCCPLPNPPHTSPSARRGWDVDCFPHIALKAREGGNVAIIVGLDYAVYCAPKRSA
jgi:hypothetical protein